MIVQQQALPEWFEMLLCCDVECKWKKHDIITFLG